MSLQHSVFLAPLARRVLDPWRMKHRALRPEPSAFDAALAHCTRQDYDSAFEALARLADDGNVPAARIALLMAEHGTRLFGRRFVASATSRRRWQALAETSPEAA